MQNARNVDEIGTALVDMVGFFASPQGDEALLREADVDIDRALFPLLIRLARAGRLNVADLAAQVGRDYTTVSRQLAKLESLHLISREDGAGDRRTRLASLTAAGEAAVRAIIAARRRLLSKVLICWSAADLAALAKLTLRFADELHLQAKRGRG